MKFHSILFSDKQVHRLQRHTLFWSVRFLLIFIDAYGSSLLTFLFTGEGKIIYNIGENMQTGSMRLFFDMVYCYTIVYWLIPKFILKRKYALFGLALVMFTLLCFAASSLFTVYYHDVMSRAPDKVKYVVWIAGIHYILGGAPVVCAAFLGLRMLKDWYLKEDEKIAIMQENAKAELQLLKAQIQPHFLFNTLNNIYSFTLAGHSQAAMLADRLSGMMDYMSREGEKEFVPLEKEIQLIKDYISLEKVRYDDRLDLDVSITGDYRHKLIAPLLMIPFAENCFKHGASVVRGKQWVVLRIHAEGRTLQFELSNSKSPQNLPSTSKQGIGLVNVEKRLKLIYPGRHTLRIEVEELVYRVHLSLTLHEDPAVAGSYIQQPTEFTSYA
jgi:sensor histidine kinase YesM